MSEISDRFRHIACSLTARLADVPDAQWGNPAARPGWTARDLVGHVVDATESYFPMVDHQPPAHPPASDDPIAAWSAARDGMQVMLDDHRTAIAEYDGMAGRTTLEADVSQRLCPELVVHAWDLAHSAGLDEHLDPDDVHQAMALADEEHRTCVLCGPRLEPPPGAGEQAQLLAFFGRTV